ncbi:MAG: dihydropteroate synthase [Desulfovibrionaceae bacterium]|nr:dihydropteroate synthase [Desulfovibrionaceae bacterium]
MSYPPFLLAGDCLFKPKEPYGLMGIVNLTADSFYTSSRTQESAINLALEHLDQGADVLDLGAESTRPYAKPLTSEDELSRLLPVINELKASVPEAILSVDTYHAATAAKVLSLGVSIINDISACRFDPDLLDVLVQYKPGYVLMHSQGRPKDMQDKPSYNDVVYEVQTFFEQHLNMLVKAGLPEEHILLDPGIGFGKLLEHNMAILKHISAFKIFKRPLLIGLSMKSMFGDLLGLKLHERGQATSVASALLFDRGVFWHRVHDVGKTAEALKLAQAFF